MSFYRYSLIFIMMMTSTSIFSQEKFDFTYESESDVFGETRKFYVHLHDDYYLDGADSCGVIYVLDAQSKPFFENTRAIIDYLVWNYQIPPMIVVGIHSEDRGREFIPLDESLSPNDEENSGQAEKLRQHLREEVFPVVDQYRINSFRAIIGHSRAGAFLANTIFGDERDLFNAYIAVSPGMHYLDNQIMRQAKSRIVNQTAFGKFYYCSTGTVGTLEALFGKQVSYLDSLFLAHPNPSLQWHRSTIEGRNHWGIVSAAVAEGVIEMCRAYQVDQFLVERFAANSKLSVKDQIESYEDGQRAKLGMVFPVKASCLRNYGNQLKGLENHEAALDVFELSIDRDPANLDTYIDKADTHLRLGDRAGMIETMKKAAVATDGLGLTPDELSERKSRIKQFLENNPE